MDWLEEWLDIPPKGWVNRRVSIVRALWRVFVELVVFGLVVGAFIGGVLLTYASTR